MPNGATVTVESVALKPVFTTLPSDLKRIVKEPSQAVEVIVPGDDVPLQEPNKGADVEFPS